MANPIVNPETAAQLKSKYLNTSEANETVIQQASESQVAEPQVAAQSNVGIGQEIVAGTLGIAPEEAKASKITSTAEDKALERDQFMKNLSPEHQDKVQEATRLDTTTLVDESREAMIDRIMADDTLTLAEKTKALEDFKNKSSALSKTANDIISDELQEKRAAFQKAKAEVEAYNKTVEGTKYPLKELPTLSDFGLSPVATGETIIKSSMPTEEQVEKDAANMQNQISKEEAARRALARKQQEEADKLTKAQEEIKRQDEEMQAIDPNKFWNNRSTGQQIALGLALFTGGYSAGLSGKENQALNFISKMIDNDIESQKLTNDQKLAKQKLALDKVITEASALEKQTQSQLNIANIQKLKNDMMMKREEIAAQQLRLKMFQSGDGDIDPLLDDEQRKRAVVINGKTMLAQNTKAMEIVKEAQKEKVGGLSQITKILSMQKDLEKFPTSGGSFADRELLKANLEILVSDLRMALMGPGVFTPDERELVRGVIGNPTSFLRIESIEWDKLRSVRNSIHNNLIGVYKDNIPGFDEKKHGPSRDLIEVGTEKIRARNPNMSRTEAKRIAQDFLDRKQQRLQGK